MEALKYRRQVAVAAPEQLGSICMLTNVHSPFDQRIFYKEAQALVQGGYRVVVVGPGPAEWCGLCDGVEIQTVPVPNGVRHRLCNLGRLLWAGLATKADCYHFHDPELLLVGVALRLFGRRVVYDVHEHFPLVALVRPWVPARLRRVLAATVDIVERSLARHLTAVVGVVEEQGQRFATRPFAVVKNYPRLECFAPGGKKDGPYSLVHIGSLSEDRGGLFLLEIMRELAKTHPQVRLLSVGRFHSPALRQRFAARRREWGLEANIDCCETRVRYDELGALIGACRVGLIPGQVSAKNMAAFVPTKLFEYLACGVPVVASDLPSIRNFRARADWGTLADPSDPADHARAIGCLLDDPREARAKGIRGRHAAEAFFNWDAEAEKLLEFYAAIMPRERERVWDR